MDTNWDKGAKEGICAKSTGPVDNIQSDAPLGGNIKSARHRAFRHKARFAPVRSAWRSAMREICRVPCRTTLQTSPGPAEQIECPQ
jgi:hypothetical protein